MSNLWTRIAVKLSSKSNSSLGVAWSQFKISPSGSPITHSGKSPDKNVLTLPNLMKLLVSLVALLVILQPGTLSIASADTVHAKSNIQAIFGTAVEVRAPQSIVVASSSGLVDLHFDQNSELRIDSELATVADVSEGDRVISTAHDVGGELVALKTIVKLANSKSAFRHIVGVVSDVSEDTLSIQTRFGDVVQVANPAGLDELSPGDGLTLVARLDRSSGILTAIGFELTAKTIARIEAARDQAKTQAELDRLSQITVEARSKHLSGLDDTMRALQRIIDSERTDESERSSAEAKLRDLRHTFDDLVQIYTITARSRNEALPTLRISGALVAAVGSASFTVAPTGEEDLEQVTVGFSFDSGTTRVDLPSEISDMIPGSGSSSLLLTEAAPHIPLGSRFVVEYTLVGVVREVVSIRIEPPELDSALEAVLEAEISRAFHGVITLVEIDPSLEDALGILLVTNESAGSEVTVKIGSATEITLNDEVSFISDLAVGQFVDLQLETGEAGGILDITSTSTPLRTLAVRARTSVPDDEIVLSGVVESVDGETLTISIRPSDGAAVTFNVDAMTAVVRDGEAAPFSEVRVGDLVVNASRSGSASTVLTRLVTVPRTNLKFSGTITGIGREPDRIQVTSSNGVIINILVSEESWLILDGRRVQFSGLRSGLTVTSGTYSVTGQGGAFYNVATIISIESPKVERVSGVITDVHPVEGTVTLVTGQSTSTRILVLKIPSTPLGENLTKNGRGVRSLLSIERDDRVDIAIYQIETGIIERLSVVSEEFVQSRGRLLAVSGDLRYVTVELANGELVELWSERDSSLQLNGRQVEDLGAISERFNSLWNSDNLAEASVFDVLFIKDSIESTRGVIGSIQIEIISLDESEEADLFQPVEITVTGVIEAIRGSTWVIGGQVFTVNSETQFLGADPVVGLVAKAILKSKPNGQFEADLVSVTASPD